jgi:hypothetical protein
MPKSFQLSKMDRELLAKAYYQVRDALRQTWMDFQDPAWEGEEASQLQAACHLVKRHLRDAGKLDSSVPVIKALTILQKVEEHCCANNFHDCSRELQSAIADLQEVAEEQFGKESLAAMDQARQEKEAAILKQMEEEHRRRDCLQSCHAAYSNFSRKNVRIPKQELAREGLRNLLKRQQCPRLCLAEEAGRRHASVVSA